MQAIVKFPNGKEISFNGLNAKHEAERFVFALWIEDNVLPEILCDNENRGPVVPSLEGPPAPVFLKQKVSCG